MAARPKGIKFSSLSSRSKARVTNNLQRSGIKPGTREWSNAQAKLRRGTFNPFSRAPELRHIGGSPKAVNIISSSRGRTGLTRVTATKAERQAAAIHRNLVGNYLDGKPGSQAKLESFLANPRTRDGKPLPNKVGGRDLASNLDAIENAYDSDQFSFDRDDFYPDDDK